MFLQILCTGQFINVSLTVNFLETTCMYTSIKSSTSTHEQCLKTFYIILIIFDIYCSYYVSLVYNICICKKHKHAIMGHQTCFKCSSLEFIFRYAENLHLGNLELMSQHRQYNTTTNYFEKYVNHQKEVFLTNIFLTNIFHDQDFYIYEC